MQAINMKIQSLPIAARLGYLYLQLRDLTEIQILLVKFYENETSTGEFDERKINRIHEIDSERILQTKVKYWVKAEIAGLELICPEATLIKSKIFIQENGAVSSVSTSDSDTTKELCYIADKTLIWDHTFIQLFYLMHLLKIPLLNQNTSTIKKFFKNNVQKIDGLPFNTNSISSAIQIIKDFQLISTKKVPLNKETRIKKDSTLQRLRAYFSQFNYN
ncbi:MAG: hypothetical protein NT007_13750 [Candidatus Kapabacteria bacterium]|nr:hypothetical protein [Candidatus Kapabacteria bacterium]